MSGWRKRQVMEMAREAGFERLGHMDNDWVCLPEDIEAFAALVRADEREIYDHDMNVLINAIWKSCGDDKEVVQATIDSQGTLMRGQA